MVLLQVCKRASFMCLLLLVSPVGRFCATVVALIVGLAAPNL